MVSTRLFSIARLEMEVPRRLDNCDLDFPPENRWLYFGGESFAEPLKSKLSDSCLQSFE